MADDGNPQTSGNETPATEDIDKGVSTKSAVDDLGPGAVGGVLPDGGLPPEDDNLEHLDPGTGVLPLAKDTEIEENLGQDVRPKRDRKFTEKAKENLERDYDNTRAKFRTEAGHLGKLIGESKSYENIQRSRDTLTRLQMQISELADKHFQFIGPDPELKREVKVIEERSDVLIDKANDAIAFLLDEVSSHGSSIKSHRTHRSKNGSHRSGKKTVQNIPAPSRVGSTGSRHDDVTAQAIEDVAKLTAEIPFVEAEQQIQKVILEKKVESLELQNQAELLSKKKALAVASAKIGSLSGSVASIRSLHATTSIKPDVPASNPLPSNSVPVLASSSSTTGVSLNPTSSRPSGNNSSLRASAPEFQPSLSSSQLSSSDNVEIMKAVIEKTMYDRTPAPEPGIFTGDPLQYQAWKTAFNILIDEKNIAERQKFIISRST